MALTTNKQIKSVSYNGTNIKMQAFDEINNSNGMNTVKTQSNIGNLYKFTGTSDGNYINNRIYCVESAQEYIITTNLTNITADSNNITTIQSGKSAILKFSANDGYYLPSIVTVTGAESSWHTRWGGIGVLFICNPSSNVTITITASIVFLGQTLYMNLDGSSKSYKVIKDGAKNVEVMCMFDPASNMAFGTDYYYANSTIDTYLNTTYYNTLTTTAKAAIVDKTFTQDCWGYNSNGSPVYSGHYGGAEPEAIYEDEDDIPEEVNYSFSLNNSAFGSQITRHCYALSVKDVAEYLVLNSYRHGTKFEDDDILIMFWNTDETQEKVYWLRSSDTNTSFAWRIYGYNGSISTTIISDTSLTVRPAMTLDLTKISWSD